MDFHFNILKQTRLQMLAIIDSHSLEELLHIPKGFNNHILWNFGHALVIQELLLYALSGKKTPVDESIVLQFRKGSSPMETCTEDLLTQLKKMALDGIETSRMDYEKGVFEAYKTYTTGYHITLTSAEEAIAFNNTHEALHLGLMKGISRCVKEEV